MTFALMLSTAARQRRLDREIRRIEDMLRARDRTANRDSRCRQEAHKPG
jgi:hypothetical protein